MINLGIVQRVLPVYRASLFDLLAQSCPRGLSVFAGQPLPQEGIAGVDRLELAHLVQARNHHLFDPSSPFFFCWQSGLAPWLESCQPEALIIEANPRYLSSRLAVHWMHARKRPVLGWGLGAPPLTNIPKPGKFWSKFRAWERSSFLHSLDGWIAYSQRGAAEYCRLGLPADRVFVAYNAAERCPTRPPPTRPNYWDQDFPKNGKPRVLFVGRLQSRKRIDLLLRACATLPVEMKPSLQIVGDGPARSDLEQLAQSVYPSAEFVGARHGSDLEPYYAMADLFVLPGTGGLAIQQAMTFALPVIVAQGDGTQEDLVRPDNGWLVAPSDFSSLSKTLQFALADVGRLRRMGLESYRIVSQEINLEKMVEVFLSAVECAKAWRAKSAAS